jgi:DNA modification methylase
VTIKIIEGDCLATLAALPQSTYQCCVTSPPYYGLRDYGHAGQIGLEASPDEYVARMVDVFREVRRVLRDDGTLWLNIGDSYTRGEAKGGNGPGGKNVAAYGAAYASAQSAKAGSSDGVVGRGDRPGSRLAADGVKYKDLLGIPWQLAFALRADGWFLRSDIIWHKPNPMPESVTDRPTSAHEHVFLLSKSARYFYDAGAIAEAAEHTGATGIAFGGATGGQTGNPTYSGREYVGTGTRNVRNVWTIATQPYSGAHFATMPPALAERCIKAGTRPGDHVLDPFGGAGTTGLVADRLGRNATLCELNPAYAALARERIAADSPLLAVIA